MVHSTLMWLSPPVKVLNRKKNHTFNNVRLFQQRNHRILRTEIHLFIAWEHFRLREKAYVCLVSLDMHLFAYRPSITCDLQTHCLRSSIVSSLKVFLFALSLRTNDDVLVNSISAFKHVQKCLWLSCNCVELCPAIIISTGPVSSVCLQERCLKESQRICLKKGRDQL